MHALKDHPIVDNAFLLWYFFQSDFVVLTSFLFFLLNVSIDIDSVQPEEIVVEAHLPHPEIVILFVRWHIFESSSEIVHLLYDVDIAWMDIEGKPFRLKDVGIIGTAYFLIPVRRHRQAIHQPCKPIHLNTFLIDVQDEDVAQNRFGRTLCKLSRVQNRLRDVVDVANLLFVELGRLSED